MREQQLDQRHVPVESGFMERPMAAAHKVRIRFRGAPLPWRTVLGCAAREVVESVDACNVQRRLTREYPSASFSSTSAWTASSLCKPASDTASLSRASSCSQRRALASLRSFVLAASCSLPPGAAASVSAAAAASGIPWSLIAARQRTRSPPAGKRPPMLRRETVTRCRAALQSQIRTKRQNQEAWPCPSVVDWIEFLKRFKSAARASAMTKSASLDANSRGESFIIHAVSAPGVQQMPPAGNDAYAGGLRATYFCIL